MSKLQTLAALIAVALTINAHAGDSSVAQSREYKAAGRVAVTIMPAGVDLGRAQDRLRAFLIDQDAEILTDEAGVIEARTPFAIDHSDDGHFAAYIQDTMANASGHVWFKRRVIRLSQDAGGVVRIEWCHRIKEKNVAGVRVPSRVGCSVTFREWQMLREIAAPLTNP